MIQEFATIRVLEGHADAFVAAVAAARPLFAQAQGFRSLALKRSIEQPECFYLFVGWNSVENHMVDFRNSPAFGAWRALVGPHFAGAPVVEHLDEITLPQ